MGVDPGVSGASVVLSIAEGNVQGVLRHDSTLADWAEWWTGLQIEGHVLFGVLERVSAMPQQGVSSTFKFGTSFGQSTMSLVFAKVPYDLVTPGVWQRNMSCLSKGDKNITKARAQQLFPHTKITHRNADALLIAEYARRLYLERHVSIVQS